MSEPRRIIPGTVYLVTRRVLERRFLLRPDKNINLIFDYCLAVAAKRCNIGIITYLMMSNHYHAVVYDADGRVPEFLECFHKVIAKTLNVHHNRVENLWSSEETCLTRLVSPEDVFDKIVYVLMNPVRARLVDSVEQWPGASSWRLMGKSAKVIERPKAYFRRKRSVMPPTIEIEIVPPPNLSGETYEEFIGRVKRTVALQEHELRNKRREQNLPLLGRKRVLATDPNSAPHPAAREQKLRPALACKDHERMKIERAILRGFRVAHESARIAFIGGDRAVVFPAGTYRFLRLGVTCEPIPIAA